LEAFHVLTTRSNEGIVVHHVGGNHADRLTPPKIHFFKWNTDPRSDM
jgi:hypothetical protein